MTKAHFPFTRFLWALAAIGFALRFGYRAARGEADFWANGYTIFGRLARSLVEGSGYALNGQETAFRVPFYPLYLAVIGGPETSFWAIAIVQSLASVLTAILAALIARRLFGEGPAILAGIIATFWPYAISHDTALQETGLFTSLVMVSVWLLLKVHDHGRIRDALAAGLFLGMAALTRTTILPFAAFAMLWIIWGAGNSQPLINRIAAAGTASLAMIAALSPWLVYSADVLGRPAMGAETGRAIYAAQHEDTFLFYPDQSIDQSRRAIFRQVPRAERRELAQQGALAREDWFMSEGLQAMRDNPGRTFRYGVRKLVAAFGPLPSPRKGTLIDTAYAAHWFPIFLLGLYGLWLSRAHWRRDAIFYGLIGSFAAVSALIWAHTSHRSFLDYYFIIFAAFALARLAGTRWMQRALVHMPAPVRGGVGFLASSRTPQQ